MRAACSWRLSRRNIVFASSLHFHPRSRQLSQLSNNQRNNKLTNHDLSLKPSSVQHVQPLLFAIPSAKCGGCVTSIEKAAISAMNGLGTASADVLRHELCIVPPEISNSDTADIEERVTSAVRKAGFDCEKKSEQGGDMTRSDQFGRKSGTIAGAAIALAIGTHLFDHFDVNAYTQLALAGPATLWLGRSFFRPAWLRLKAWQPATMDTLVALGVGAAVGGSTAQIVLGMWSGLGVSGPLYFDAGAMITAAVLTGRWLESRATGKAVDAVSALTALGQGTVQRVRYEEQIEEEEVNNLDDKQERRRSSPRHVVARLQPVPVDWLQRGDVILVTPGAAIPVDGTIVDPADGGQGRSIQTEFLLSSDLVDAMALSGNTPPANLTSDSAEIANDSPANKDVVYLLDDSLMTGETAALEAHIGSRVQSGSINRSARPVYVRADAVGAATRLHAVAATVEQAQRTKPDVQRLVDRVAGVFVPGMLGLSLATAGYWGLVAGAPTVAFESALSVLVAACPCALGLATPVAMQVALSNAARYGAIIRSATALEQASKISAVVFDKTGTLTTGQRRVTAFEQLSSTRRNNKLSRRDILTIVRSAEEGAAANPVARGLLAFATAQLNGDSSPIDQTSGLDPGAIQASTRSTVGVGVNVTVAGIGEVTIGSLAVSKRLGATFSAADEINIANWQRSGNAVVTMLVDREPVALFALSDEVRVDAAAVVAELQRRKIQCFIASGDASESVNYISEAVGVSSKSVFAQCTPGRKLEIIEELRSLQGNARIVAMVGDGVNDAAALASADLAGVTGLIDLSSRTMRVIRQNLFWAFGYNAVILPLAMSHALPPELAAAAMAGSSLTVVLNSLRLARK